MKIFGLIDEQLWAPKRHLVFFSFQFYIESIGHPYKVTHVPG
jgi:hypothetical protein